MKRNTHYHRFERVSSASKRIKNVSLIRINYLCRRRRPRPGKLLWCGDSPLFLVQRNQSPPPHVYVCDWTTAETGRLHGACGFFCPVDFFIIYNFFHGRKSDSVVLSFLHRFRSARYTHNVHAIIIIVILVILLRFLPKTTVPEQSIFYTTSSQYRRRRQRLWR